MELWAEKALINVDSVIPDRILSEDMEGIVDHTISDGTDRESIRKLIGMVDWVLVRCTDWTMIPLENLISDMVGSGTRLCVEISRNEDVPGAIFALEIGVDGLLLPDDSEIWGHADTVRKSRPSFIPKSEDWCLEPFEVTHVEEGGIGERVCIDLTERMEVGEGLFTGSFSSCLLLLQAEVMENTHVPPRPFRVNAGAVHAYVLTPEGNTRYLEELRSGDMVEIWGPEGPIRTATIGRMKIERRPFLTIRGRTERFEGQIMVQQAETVKFIDNEGNSISATDIIPGQILIAYCMGSARHIGKAVPSGVREV
jgi:3-dehydroquinate synthase II